mmetsp:Transcript_6455/g.10207  ORF Transcript_6455/g.10207 Transcript_6455/m.10207 type:complete len:155 (-) Transcript_6455:1536-2000(-)
MSTDGSTKREGREGKRTMVDFGLICRMHGCFMCGYGCLVFFICLVEGIEFLRIFRSWGLTLNWLYKDVDGKDPSINAVYRILALVMFGIGLYELKMPDLDEQSKAFFRKAFVLYLLPCGLSFGYDGFQSYSGPLTLLTAFVPLTFAAAGLFVRR